MLNGYAQALALLRTKEHRQETSVTRSDSEAPSRAGTLTANWNGIVLAESDHTVEIEGNRYFPPEAIRWEYFVPSEHRTVCPWKGEAVYYHVKVGESLNQDTAWSYPEPKKAAAEIKDHVAFGQGVSVR